MSPPPARRAPAAMDLLARLAVFYLAAVPAREGVLIRELNASFEVDGLRETWPEAIGSRQELLEWVKQRRDTRLAAVDGNAALLGRRRADAVWFDVTDREHPLVEVHEIKASRADLAAELRRPEKSAAWRQRAHRFWLTVPDASLVEGFCIPEEWGVLAVSFGAAPVVVREAPELTPTVSVRPDVLAFVRRNAVRRWRYDGDRVRPSSGRYTVASRLRPAPGNSELSGTGTT